MKMTVGDYVAALSKLPQDLPVVKNWEGEIIEVVGPRQICVSKGVNCSSMHEEYYPEIKDEDYEQFEAVQIG